MFQDDDAIDEIHYIRNAGSKTAKLACLLKAKHKWGLTGTPIQNSCKDLISLYRFTGIPDKINNPTKPNILSNKIEIDVIPILKPFLISKYPFIASPPTVEGNI